MWCKLLLLSIVGSVSAQTGAEDFDYSGGSGYRKPPPAILMHKQALTQDGSFNYVFAAENGLKQGETISPDGTRTGAYSYVDPSGQTVSVKYSAGKDGFKIIEGSHVPKPPPHVVQQLQAKQRYAPPPAIIKEGPPSLNYLANQRYQDPSGPSGPGGAAGAGRYEDESPRTSYHDSNPPSSFRSAPRPQPAPVNEYVPGPEDEHRGPHSFGSGYSFEFAG